MAVELKVADCTQRLADQLQTLSEVAETLTFRLLELEERLAAQELKVQSLLEAQGGALGDMAEDTELRLGDTEDRLARLEGLLSGLESPSAARHLHPVVSPAAAPDPHAHQDTFLDDTLTEEAFLEEEEQPFPEDQPFLDELSA
ncbi:MAG: hypothetical protein VKM34_08840 [Cyanobacteriota bacterium]|nr:hypothetical protein [Cyanobacteriota bacterium]